MIKDNNKASHYCILKMLIERGCKICLAWPMAIHNNIPPVKIP